MLRLPSPARRQYAVLFGCLVQPGALHLFGVGAALSPLSSRALSPLSSRALSPCPAGGAGGAALTSIRCCPLMCCPAGRVCPMCQGCIGGALAMLRYGARRGDECAVAMPPNSTAWRSTTWRSGDAARGGGGGGGGRGWNREPAPCCLRTYCNTVPPATTTSSSSSPSSPTPSPSSPSFPSSFFSFSIRFAATFTSAAVSGCALLLGKSCYLPEQERASSPESLVCCLLPPAPASPARAGPETVDGPGRVPASCRMLSL